MSVIPPCETGADRPQAGTSSTTTSVVVASEESQAAKYCLDCEYCSTRRQQITKKNPRHLIPELCALFYDLKWVTGTGGSISIREGPRIYITPSGVHKERILPEDLFVLNDDEKELDSPPKDKGFKSSQCTPLFFSAYKLRNAGAVIHTHSIHAVLVTMMLKGEEGKGKAKEWRISQQEMIKGLRIGSTKSNYRYFDEICVPIIENTAEEQDLKESMVQAIQAYPKTNAVLVRRHGIYVWGESWEKAKSMCECYDYLLQLTVDLLKLGMDPCSNDDDRDYSNENPPPISGP